MLRIIALILGLAVAACGGVIAYRALFLEARTATLVTETNVHQLPDMLRVASGFILLVVGACVAFFAARRKPM
jgi:hypothetical protein